VTEEFTEADIGQACEALAQEFMQEALAAQKMSVTIGSAVGRHHYAGQAEAFRRAAQIAHMAGHKC
jgi:hypothetical protein